MWPLGGAVTLSILGAVILTFATGGRCDFHCLHWGVILIVATGGRCDRWEINRRCEPWGESLSPLCGPPRGHCWSSKGPSESLRSSKGSLLGVIVVLQGDVGGVVSLLGVAVGHCWSSKGTLLVLQRDIGVVLSLGCHRGPPRGHCWSSKGSAVSPWSSKGALLVLQRVSSVTVVLQGGIVGPPRGHWCCIVTIGCQTWSSKGRTLLVLQRDVDCHWSSKGTLLVLQRDVGCHCGPPAGHCWSSKGTSVSCRHCWVSPWSSKGA